VLLLRCLPLRKHSAQVHNYQSLPPAACGFLKKLKKISAVHPAVPGSRCSSCAKPLLAEKTMSQGYTHTVYKLKKKIAKTDDEADPTCSKGVLAIGNSRCCCSKRCGVCGGTSCQNHQGGRDDCCCGSILKANRSCDKHDPPCVADPSPPPPPTPPVPPGTVNPKRGFVADSSNATSHGVKHNGTCDDPGLLHGCGWYVCQDDVAPPAPWTAVQSHVSQAHSSV